MDWSLEFLSSVQYFGGFKEVKKLYKTFGLEPQKEKWPQSHRSVAIDVTTELESDLMKKHWTYSAPVCDSPGPFCKDKFSLSPNEMSGV